MLPRKTRTRLDTATAQTRTARRLAKKARSRRRAAIAVIAATVAVMAAVLGVALPHLTGSSARLTASSQQFRTHLAAGRYGRSGSNSAPSTPTHLTASAVSAAKVALSWRENSDSGAVVHYRVYRNGTEIASTASTSYADSQVQPDTRYTYTVSATDAAGAVSEHSTPATVTTPNGSASPSGAASPSASDTPTTTTPTSATPSASASSSSGVASPSGFPGASNSGYANAPGYTGTLSDCSTNIESNTTYRNCDFPDGLTIGSSSSHPTDVTFVGCRFASNSVVDADVADYGSNITFSYDTFEPNTVSASSEPTAPTAAAVSYNQGYEYGIDQRYSGALTVDDSDMWGFGDAIQFGYSSQSAPVTVSNTWIHNPRDNGGVDHTDGILENYGHLSYMVFNHNTITGNGNTNGLALQGPDYSHVTITNNYFSGYGYMVNTGGNSDSTDMTFTGNVWGTDIEPGWGPLYGNAMYTTPSLGGVWKDNTIYVAPGTSWMAKGNNGLYWWPTDGNPSSSSQIVGHTTDYSAG